MSDLSSRLLPRSWRAAARTVVAGCLIGASGFASAGVVTTFNNQMDQIFSQASFSSISKSIDIRFNDVVTVVAPDFLSINLSGEFNALSSLRGSLASNIVSVFFVDTITSCGSGTGNIIGCGSTPGNVIALNSSWAARSDVGANLLAHELGHNLGLDHVMGNNLMNGQISNFDLNNGSFLNSAQVNSIFETISSQSTQLRNGIIQGNNASGYFISITPYAVVSSVPEPQTWAMMVLGLLGMGVWVRRRQPRVCSA